VAAALRSAFSGERQKCRHAFQHARHLTHRLRDPRTSEMFDGRQRVADVESFVRKLWRSAVRFA
jgi:hypothetical protein